LTALYPENRKITEKGGVEMRKIIISVQNRLLGDALVSILEESGEFEPSRVIVDRKKRTAAACAAFQPEIVLMEVAQTAVASVKERMKEVYQIRALLPDCKVVFLCDEHVSPQVAEEVVGVRKNREIDAFCYSSVTMKNMLATLSAL
jgi:chemotaxis response regulator CheB